MLEIKNISNVEQKDIKITINENELIEIDSIETHFGDTTEEINKDTKTFTIKSIKPGEKAYVRIQTTIGEVTDKTLNP
jgi:calcineurin-like phosphoesterase family protein